ncbi:flagellar biosynthesis protein FliQ [Scatolibacter rhodanostii]|uniref:flagellar biosynthesis protein FliQ n=1 Tax=Scatolibacter rhodanostii TaxID=2014781 RepID=UPI000C06D0C7|nr:flagellar biosynthesis protein FliQ [Scatolibacter rhodanostii]
MSQEDVLLVFREAVWMILKLSAPLLIVSIAIGLIVAIFQAATQIHEQTITFVPKIIAIALLLLASGSWMLTSLMDFFHYLMNLMAEL